MQADQKPEPTGPPYPLQAHGARAHPKPLRLAMRAADRVQGLAQPRGLAGRETTGGFRRHCHKHDVGGKQRLWPPASSDSAELSRKAPGAPSCPGLHATPASPRTGLPGRGLAEAGREVPLGVGGAGACALRGPTSRPRQRRRAASGLRQSPLCCLIPRTGVSFISDLLKSFVLPFSVSQNVTRWLCGRVSPQQETTHDIPSARSYAILWATGEEVTIPALF